MGKYFSDVNRLDRNVHERFKYRNDKDDFWKSSAEQFKADPRYIIKDDCDGLASTCVHLAAQEGIPEKRLYRAIVKTTDGPREVYADHMIALLEDSDGEWYIFGDTFGRMRPLSRENRYSVIEVSRVSEGIKWRTWDVDREEQ